MVCLSCLAGAHRSLHAVLETACFATPVVSPKCLLGLCLDMVFPPREVLLHIGAGGLVAAYFWRIECMFNQVIEHVFFRFTPRVESWEGNMWNTSKIRCLTSSPPLGPQCQPPEILFKIGPKVHMRIISINSMRKSKKIPGRRLSIVPSSCAWVSCWFWIVMLHRSRGVLAKNGKIQAERDPSFNRKLPKIRFATSFQQG